MGFLSWIFPSPADKIAKARRFLARDDPGSARLMLEGLEGEEAQQVRLDAEAGLVRLNLEQARICANAGELPAATEHVQLAANFAGERFGTELRQARRVLREARSSQRQAAQARAAAKASGPLGGSCCASGSCGGGAPVPPETPSAGFGGDPIFSLPPDHPQVRYALLLEAYPEELRARYMALGRDFAEAVLALEDGQASQAFQRLEAFVEREPAARFQRGLAALQTGQAARAASELRAFGAACGHQRLGRVHSAVLLARALGADGRRDEALRVLQQARERADDPELMANQVALLEAGGRLAEADALGVELLRLAPRDMGVHKLLARIRLKGGKRMEAMQVLESGLSKLCKGPGKCGSQPLDVDAARMLAQLYLEDRLEPRRCEELLRDIATSGAESSWLDAYLQALRARNQGDPGFQEQARALLRGLPENHPGRAAVQERLIEV